MKNKRLFHYTVGQKIPLIQIDGCIKQATAFVPKDELPAVWCTYKNDWEETANKLYERKLDNIIRNLTREQTDQVGNGLYRIEVDPTSAPLTWEQFIRQSNIKKKSARSLKKIARKVGSDIRDWRASFNPIYADNWLSIEFWNGNDWETYWEPGITELDVGGLVLH